MRNELSHEWGVFLSQFQWDWFISLTLRDATSSFRVDRLFRRLMWDIELAAGNKIAWFMVFEYGTRTGRLHIHALVQGVSHLSPAWWMEEWNRRAGYARIFPFDPRKGGVFYCAKYMTKTECEWEIEGLPENGQRVLPLPSPKFEKKIEKQPRTKKQITEEEPTPMRFSQTKHVWQGRDWESEMLRTTRRWNKGISR